MNEITDYRRFICLNIRRWYYILAGIILGMLILGGGYFIKNNVLSGDLGYRCKALYYITFDFEENSEIHHYYNAYTWNDIIDTEPLAGKVSEITGLDREYISGLTVIPELSDIRFFWLYIEAVNAKEAEQVQNAFSEVLGDFAKNTDGFETIELWEDSKTEPIVKTNLLGRMIILGGCLGGVVAVLLVGFVNACSSSIVVIEDGEKYLDESVKAVIFEDKSCYRTYGDSFVRDVLNSNNVIGIYKTTESFNVAYFEALKEALGIHGDIGFEEITKDTLSDKNSSVIIPVPFRENGHMAARWLDEAKSLGTDNILVVICNADKKLYKRYYGKNFKV